MIRMIEMSREEQIEASLRAAELRELTQKMGGGAARITAAWQRLSMAIDRALAEAAKHPYRPTSGKGSW